MQVATLFRDNVILSRSESTMNISSESTLTSVEEEEEDTASMSKKKICVTSDSKLPLAVCSLVSLASNALLGNDTSAKHESVVSTELGIEKIEKESNKDENSLLQSSIVKSDSVPLSDESSKEGQEISNDKTLLSYEINPVTCSPSSLDSKGPQCDTITRAPSSPLDSSLITNKTEKKICKLSYDDCEDSNHVPSSQATTLLLTENKNFSRTFFEQEQNFPESDQTQRDITSSPITIRETHGCGLKNLSNTDEMEAENLVIHQHNHMTSVPRKSSSNDYNMRHLLEKDESGKPQINTEGSLNPELEYKQQKHLISETQNEIVNNCVKQRQYTDTHHYNECLNVEELSQQSQQQMSQTSLDSNMAEYGKTEQLSSTMNMANHMEHQNQYHINQNQHQVQQHQNAQQLYLQHQDQQHVMHHHHQHQQHHSELMAYLHHQDQQAMQHPQHIRTYQHYQQQRMHQLPPPQQSSPHHQQKHTPMTCIDDLMIDDFHDDSHNRYKLLSPTVKHESQDDGYETSAGDVLTPNSHSSSHSMTPQHQVHSTNLAPPKCEDISSTHHIDPDPYNFIDDEINSNIRMMSPPSNGMSIVLRQQSYGSPSESTRLLTEERQMQLRIEGQHMVDTGNVLRMQVTNVDDISGPIPVPKKRGRKKKSAEELSTRVISGGVLKPILQKERKKHDRFNGMPEEEVSKRTLPDHLAHNLDIIIIGINPGLFAAYKGHHYAGPGNHFWKCLYLSGLTHEQMTAEEDYKLLKIGIGFTNMVERATKGSADLTRKEIKEGSRILLEKLKRFRPKIAVFNGKLIFEVFSGKKDFNFGRQQECVEGTDTYMWVMPSSSARCAQLPRAADKVPFYAALKKFRDYLNGLIPHIDDLECVFSDPKTKHCCESETKGNLSPVTGQFMAPDPLNSENQSLVYNSNRSTPERNNITDLSTNLNNNNSNGSFIHKASPMHALVSGSDNSGACGSVISRMNRPSPMSICNNTTNVSCNTGTSQPEKKKRGRPKKVKGIDGDECPNPQKVRNTNSLITTNNDILNLTLMGENGEIPKKKRGRPKKIKMDVSNNLGQNTATGNNCNNSNVTSNSLDSLSVLNGAKADTCHHRNSPNSIGNHQILTMNNCNQFSHQTLSQKQPLQNQRLFTSPMHSPNTVSSYCPVAMNAATTPPTGNTNSNNSNLGNNAGYHQQALGTAHNIQPHQHNHILQRVQHQLHIPPAMYMPSPSHPPLHSSKSPHYGSSHSELSAEISAAISSEHLGENQSDPSPAVSAVEYDRPESIANDEQSNHDLRYPSPQSNPADQQQSGSSAHHQNYHGIYHNSNSNQTYISTSNNAFSANTSTEARGVTNSNDDTIRYISNNRTHTSNSNTSTPQPQIQSQQHNMHISDMTSKSLSGLESLVDQIPAISENEASNSLNATVGSAECRSKPDSNEEFSSATSVGNAPGNSTSGGIGCIYIPPYANLNSSSSSSPALSATSNGSILSPHHYPDSIYSAANSCPSVTNTNNINYNGLTSNFSVSSLTSNSYPANSYHTNLMAAAAASSSHHITTAGPGSPMYMDPHMPVAVGSIYPHPYSQHASYSTYGPVPPPPPPPPPPTLHLPSPNYPYAYSNSSGYPTQSGHHHPSHTSSSGYPSMFDRIKPDIGFGGY